MSSKQTSGGISALGLLGVVFVVLKLAGLTEVASWSWWWVTAPFWCGIALGLAVVLLTLIVAGLLAGLALVLEVLGKSR